MRIRRGLALVMTAVAVTTSAAAAIAVATPAAASSTKACVALVVDGRALGSNVSTACPKAAHGATGVDVLQAAGHTVSFAGNGLLCTIDGLPKTGCASIDDTHYWAYFHRAAGSTHWVYSSEGPSTYEPAAGSTDGWVYDNGKALTPQNVPYAQICQCQPTPSASPTHAVTHSATPKPSPSASPKRGSNATATPTRSTTPSPSPTRTSTKAAARRHHRTRGVTSLLTATLTPTAAPTSIPSPTSAALAGAIQTPSNHHGLLDLLIGLIVIAAIGAAAAWRFRRPPA